MSTNRAPRQRYVQNEKSGGSWSRVILPGANVWEYMPSWKNTITTIRILPNFDPDNLTQFDPYRIGAGPDQFGTWLEIVPHVAWGTGDNRFAAISIPSPQHPHSDTVATFFYETIRDLYRTNLAPQHWGKLLEKPTDPKEGFYPALSQPHQELVLVQCVVYEHKGKIFSIPKGASPDHRPVVFSIVKTARDAFFAMCNKRVDNYRGDPADFAAQFECGDLVDLGRGALIRFYQKGTNLQGGSVVADDNFGSADTETANKSMESNFYECSYTRALELGGTRRNPNIAQFESMLRPRIKLWSQILNYPSSATFVQYLCEAFAADVVVAGLRNSQYTDLIPQGIRDRAVARVTSGSPGGTSPAARAAQWDSPAHQAAASTPNAAPPASAVAAAPYQSQASPAAPTQQQFAEEGWGRADPQSQDPAAPDGVSPAVPSGNLTTPASVHTPPVGQPAPGTTQPIDQARADEVRARLEAVKRSQASQPVH